MTSTSTRATLSADIDFFQESVSTYSSSFLNLQGNAGYAVSVTGGSGWYRGQIDSVYNLNGYVIPSGETRDYNFRALSGEAFGAPYSIVMTGLKGLIIRNHNTGINEMLVLKATGTNAFTNLFHGSGSGNIRIEPGGMYMYTNPLYGLAIEDANKTLYITNVGSGSGAQGSNTGIAISIVAIGTSGTG